MNRVGFACRAITLRAARFCRHRHKLLHPRLAHGDQGVLGRDEEPVGRHDQDDRKQFERGGHPGWYSEGRRSSECQYRWGRR